MTSYTAGDMLYYATGAALSTLAIGATGRYMSSSGTAPQWTAPAALTKTDDTNVTLTLGGSASTALLNAASLTLGWTGQLSVARGGTGNTTGAATAVISNATTGLMQITGPGAGTTRVMTIPNANFTAARTDAAQTFTGQQDFNSNVVINSASLQVNAGAGGYYARVLTAYNFPYVDAYIDSVASTSYEGRVCIRTNSGGGAMGERMFVWNSGGVSIGSATDPGGPNLSLTGNVVVSTSGKGIDFSATPGTGTSELLADYEEGTWTPANPQVSLTVTTALYTKIGRCVNFECRVAWPTNADTNQATITGLPFTPSAADYPVTIYSNSGSGASGYIPGSAVINIVTINQSAIITNAGLAGITLRITGFYFV